MTAQGHARTQFRRAIERKSLLGAEMALREMGEVDLVEALDYVALLAELRPAKAPRAAVRWHGRLETEASSLTLSDSALALAALLALCRGESRSARVASADVAPGATHRPPTRRLNRAVSDAFSAHLMIA